MASGVLVVLVGRAVKATEYISSASKGYRATLRLGLTTDTEDVTGTVLTESNEIPTADKVKSVCAEFVGDIMQVPPMYSALKVNGQKLVDLARKGITVEREARKITVHSLECTVTESETDYILDVHCSGGTYIRTLCADIGAKLSCGGVMATLARTEACGFDISRAHTIEALREYDKEALVSLLIPTEELFSDCESVRLPEFYEKLSRSGCEIYQKKLGTSLPVGARVRMCGKVSESNKSGFYALGEVIEGEKCKTPELGSAIKSIKIFDLG
jgi:tRNA pseudouridine55 synthase